MVPLISDMIARAKVLRVAEEVARRGYKLRRNGRQMSGACPVCGGRDRFWVDIRKNVWGCRGCGKRNADAIELVQHLDGISFRDAVLLLTGARLDDPPRRTARSTATAAPEPSAGDTHEHAMQVWRRAGTIWDTVAERYLTVTRKLVLPPDISPRVLRFDPLCRVDGELWPCLISSFCDIKTGEPRAIQRTALKSDGTPAMVGGKKRLSLGPVGSAAIKLSDDADVTMGLHIGEGLETCLSAMMEGFMPTWALGSAGAIAKFPVLNGIEALTIFGETDDGGANERAVIECAARWNAAGREVYRATPHVGGDFNDTIMMGAA